MARQTGILPVVLAVKGVVNLLFGLGLVVAPQALMGIYGAELAGAGVSLSRLFGAALLGVGAVQFLGRDMEDSPAKTLLIGAFAAADLLGLGLSTITELSGGLNPLGWAIVALYAFAGFGFGYGFLRECGRTTAAG